MSDSPLQSICRKITNHLMVTFFIFLAIIALVFYFFYQQDLHRNKYNVEQLTRLSYQINHQQALMRTTSLLEHILASDTSDDFKEDHQQLISNWQSLNELELVNVIQFEEWLVVNKKHQESIARIDNVGKSNEQLKSSSVIQLQIILNTIDELILKKAMKKNELYQLILKDDDNAVIVKRVSAHNKVLVELELLSQLKQNFIALFSFFSQLNIKESSNNFEQMNQTVTQTVTMYEQFGHQTTNTTIDAELNEQIEKLIDLLLTEQRTIAKWRGYLRLVDNYRLSLVDQHQQVQHLLYDEVREEISIPAAVAKIDNIVPSILSSLNRSTEQLFLVGIIGSLVLFLIMILLRINRVIKHYVVNNQSIVNSIVFGNNHELVQADSLEATQLKEQLSQIACPKFSDDDFIDMQKNYQLQIEFLSENTLTSYWEWTIDKQPLSQGLIDILSSDSSEQGKKSWRHYFTQENVHTLIAVARKAKNESTTQHLYLQTSSNKAVNVYIQYRNKQWLGLVADGVKQHKLEQCITELETELVLKNKEYYAIDKASGHKLNDMIVQAMLLSQSSAYVSDNAIASSQVYRQLTRMLDWLRQKQVTAHLHISAKALNLSDVSLLDEIHAAILNVISEGQYKKNQISLRIDKHLLSKATLDARLFQRLILVVCRLLLSEQFKAKLDFSVQVVDKNAGQQIIKFFAKMTTEVPMKKSPYLFDLLTKDIEGDDNRENDVNTPEIIAYFQVLLKSQHGSNLMTSLTKDGYIISFELPIAIANQHTLNNPPELVDKKTNDIINLKQANVMLLSADSDLQTLVGDYIKNAGGVIQVTANSEYLSQQLALEAITRKPLQVVILTDDVFVTEGGNIHALIADLPERFQPKLMVMQSFYLAPLHQQGFYSQAFYPLSEQSFLHELTQLMNQDKATNVIFDANLCQRFQYFNTNVEVLLAVNMPEKHQQLLRILHWLGLKVRVVSQASAMKKHWQTGRYLVLINEFSQSPFIKLSVGQSMPRGVFSFSALSTQHLSEEQKSLSVNWQLGCLPSTLDLVELTSLLTPWLKIKPSRDHHYLDVDAPRKNYSVKRVANNSHYLKQRETINKNVITGDIEQAENINPAFDMTIYTLHQGTSELAIYMLDEYMRTNNELFTKLSSSIAEKNLVLADRYLSKLIINSKILAAGKLLFLCEKLTDALKEKAFNHAQTLLIAISKELDDIAEYADAI